MKVGKIEISLILFAVILVGFFSVTTAEAATTVTVTTDKPSYGRGALVGISGAVTSGSSALSGMMVGIEIHDPSNRILSVSIAETGSQGVYSDFFQLSADAPYGTYQIYVAVSGTDVKGTGSFQVAASPPPDTTPPAISNVAASPITDTSATILWSTDEPASSQVQYGKSTSYGSTTPLDQTLGTSHTVTLSGLTPSTTYHFNVRSSDGAGNPAQSGDNTFTTLAPAQTSSTSSTLAQTSGTSTTSATSTSETSTTSTSETSTTSTSVTSTSSTSTTSAASTPKSTSTTSTSSTSTFTSSSTPEFNGNWIILVALTAVSVMMYQRQKSRQRQGE